MARKPAPAPTLDDVRALLGPDVDGEQVRKVQELGRKAWPYRFQPTANVVALRAKWSGFEPGQRDPASRRVRIAGRLRSKRGSGGIAFLDVEAQDGRMQAILEKGAMGEVAFDEALRLLNEGDWVGLAGVGCKSKRGEPSLMASKVTLLAKALVPFPDLGDADSPQIRYGKPYVGLMQGVAARSVLVKRARITQTVRSVLEKSGFLEASIPVLERVYGGANAQPFTTHSNAKDATMYLRISHELALKKLLVGGLERVYHIGPAFRNEDIDTTHNPEFTLMECYAAYWDYNDMISLTTKLFQAAVQAVNGGSLVIPATPLPDGTTRDAIDFGTFHTLTMKEAIRLHSQGTREAGELGQPAGIDVDALSDADLERILAQHNVTIRGGYVRGLGIAKLFEVFAEPKLVQPTFVIDHPRETTPLCKAHRKDPNLVERFELFIAGREHANSYSELNDPILQASLFKAQEDRRKAGDDEAPPTDTDFLEALKHGMPPAGGLGVGIDRMVMTLLGIESIKQVLAFPQVK